MERLKANGFDGLAKTVIVLMNSAMLAERSEHLCAAPPKAQPEAGWLRQRVQEQDDQEPTWRAALEGPTDARW